MVHVDRRIALRTNFIARLDRRDTTVVLCRVAGKNKKRGRNARGGGGARGAGAGAGGPGRAAGKRGGGGGGAIRNALASGTGGVANGAGADGGTWLPVAARLDAIVSTRYAPAGRAVARRNVSQSIFTHWG